MSSLHSLNPNDFPRTLEKVLNQINACHQSLLITGMRRVGKKMLLQRLAGERRHVSLDHFQALDLAQDDPDTFFRQYAPPVWIDEFERAPKLGPALRALLDGTDERGLVWLTASQTRMLRQPLAEALPANMTALELFPLSLYERQGKGREQKPFLPTGSLERGPLNPVTLDELWRIIWQGAWPEVVQSDAKGRDGFFERFLQILLDRDVFAAGVRRLPEFAKFLSILAGRIGREFVVGEVQAEAGIARETARDWLDIAVATGVVYLLPAFCEDVGKTLIKKPKLYFTDTGFAAWLCRSPSPAALRSAHNAEAFFENFVVMEILKSWRHNGRTAHFYFYRDAQRREIDLLIRKDDVYHPIAIESSDTPNRSVLKAFDVLQGHVRRGPGALVCTAPQARYLTSDVIALPVWDL